jgi:uncharacterized peroxidase-related enzyme
MTTYQLTLGSHTVESAPAEARPILAAAKAKLGFVPNMYGRMANLPALLGTYTHGYELFRAQSGLTPPEQEVVLLVISRQNGCEYCVAAHSMIAANVTKVPADALESIRTGKPIANAKLAALAAFTQAMVDKRGNPSPADAGAFLKAGYTEQHILAIVLAISVKTISNYANHLFHTPVDAAFASYAWTAAEAA